MAIAFAILPLVVVATIAAWFLVLPACIVLATISAMSAIRQWRRVQREAVPPSIHATSLRDARHGQRYGLYTIALLIIAAIAALYAMLQLL